MKNFIWILGLLAIPVLGFSQKGTISLHDFIIKENGKQVEYNKTYEETLTLEQEKDIELYTSGGVSYGVTFIYKKKGERVKLVHYLWENKDGQKKRVTRRKKEMQVLKTSIPGKLSGKNVENIVTDKKSMKSLSIIFKYDFQYLDNN